jgi:hypothetical protein
VTLGQKSSITVARIDEGKGLPVGVPDDIAAWHWVGVPGHREAAGWFCHRRHRKKESPRPFGNGGLSAADAGGQERLNVYSSGVHEG